MKRSITLLACFALLCASALSAEILPPKPKGYFNDYANAVDQATALQLNEQLAQFERDSSNQILVAVYPTMESESSIEDYTYRVKQTWQVGQTGRNNGAVLFVFVQNRQMFIQTGYGLEGALPDATCFDITHNVIAPYFKKNDYAGGLRAGVAAIIAAAKGEYKGTGKTVKESTTNTGSHLPVGLIIFLVIIAFTIFANRRGRRRRGYGFSGMGGPFIGGFGGGGWGGGSSGGGGGFSGFSGGGGIGGGGGAGSSW